MTDITSSNIINNNNVNNNTKGDRIKQLLGVDQDHHDQDDSPPRSRRGLYQSLSSSNLNQSPHPPSSSLPPAIPRSFYLGDLDIPSRLRGSRSLHASPAHNCSITQKYDPKHNNNNNQRSCETCSPSVKDQVDHNRDDYHHQHHHLHHHDHQRAPYYMSDTLGNVPLTSELADTYNSNSTRNRNESHLPNCTSSGGVQLRRHRSSQGLNSSGHCHHGGHSGDHDDHHHHHPGNNRHSIHIDSATHAAITGLETLDFPVRKKTWPPDGPRLQHLQHLQTHQDREHRQPHTAGQKDRNVHDRRDYHSKQCESSCSSGCSLVNSVVYQKMMTIAGQQHQHEGKQGQHGQQCYIMCCCSSSSSGQPNSSAHAHLSRAQSGTVASGPGDRSGGGGRHCEQCDRDRESGQSYHGDNTGNLGHTQPPTPDTDREGQCSGSVSCCQDTCDDTCRAVDMVRLETSHLWTGVSGVPGLGVSIPRSLSSSRPVSSLDEWDRHDHRHKNSDRKNSVPLLQPPRCNSKDQQVGSNSRNNSREGSLSVVLPRVLSPRSSSCRSSGRSTGSRGSSALNQGLSSGSSSSSSKYSNRSDSVFSNSHHGSNGPRVQSPYRGQHQNIVHQSKSIQNPVNLFHKSSNAKRKGNFQIKEGHVSLPVSATCDCVCTCGDPVPPKPVRRVMFSDDMCAGCGESAGSTSSDRLKSLPIFPPPPPHPSDHPSPSCSSSSPDCCSCREDEIQNHESAVFDSGAANSHYKSPHEVDGEYSYAYSDSVSPAFLIRVGASINYSGSGEDESDSKENIYEEIKDKPDDNLDKSSSKDSRKSSSMSQDAETQSQTKSKFQKALEAVTRRSSRSLDVGSEKSFHLSISKGRKKSLIDKAKVDWDCYGPEMDRGRDACLHSKLNKSSSDMLGEVNSSHDRVMSQLKLDVENMLMPPPSPPGDDTQDDSGFHSGGHSSNNSYSPKNKRKSIIKPPKGITKRSESQPGRMNRCESIDFKDAFPDNNRKHSEVFRTRSRIISEHTINYGPAMGHYGPPSSIYSVGPPILVPNPAVPGKKGSVNRGYLSKLVNFPFMSSNKSPAPPSIYGKNNNLPPPPHYEDESGRNFYL